MKSQQRSKPKLITNGHIIYQLQNSGRREKFSELSKQQQQIYIDKAEQKKVYFSNNYQKLSQESRKSKIKHRIKYQPEERTLYRTNGQKTESVIQREFKKQLYEQQQRAKESQNNLFEDRQNSNQNKQKEEFFHQQNFYQNQKLTKKFKNQTQQQNFKIFKHLNWDEQLLNSKGFYRMLKIFYLQQIFFSQQENKSMRSLNQSVYYSPYQTVKDSTLQTLLNKIDSLVNKITKNILDLAGKFYLELDLFQKRTTSLWQIRKLFQRSILWHIKYNLNQQQFVIYFMNQYRQYIYITALIIISSGQISMDQSQLKPSININQQSKKLSLRQIILQQLQKVNKNKKAKNKHDFNQYFYQTIKTLFDVSDHPFWQSFLQSDQNRFSQTKNLSKAQEKSGIIFTPTIYTAQIFKYIFNGIKVSIPFQMHRYFQSQLQKKYFYYMGGKQNGKSHSLILARILYNHLIQYKCLFFSTFQKCNTTKSFTNKLMCLLTRDNWFHLKTQFVSFLDKINKNNFQPSPDYPKQALRSDFQTLETITILSNQSNQNDNNIFEQIKDKLSQNLSPGFSYLRSIISRINKIHINLFIVDQFNYFGREMYKCQNIENKKQKVYNLLSTIFFLKYLHKQLDIQTLRTKLFSSPNNFPYRKLFTNIFGSYNNYQHQVVLRSTLFEGHDIPNQLYFYLQIYKITLKYYIRKEEQRSQLQTIMQTHFNKDSLQLICVKIPFALSLRQINELGSFYFSSILKKKFDIDEETELAIKFLTDRIVKNMSQMISNYVQQNCKSQKQAQKVLNQIFMPQNLPLHLSLQNIFDKNTQFRFLSICPSNMEKQLNKLHKGYQYFLNILKSDKLSSEIIQKINQNSNFKFQISIIRMITNHFHQLAKRRQYQTLQNILVQAKVNFGYAFQNLLTQFFKNNKKIKFNFEVQDKKNIKKFEFNFNKIIIYQSDNDLNNLNFLQKFQQATKGTALNDLSVIKPIMNNQACNFQLLWKSTDQKNNQKHYFIALEVKTGSFSSELNQIKICKKFIQAQKNNTKGTDSNFQQVKKLIDSKIQFYYCVGHSNLEVYDQQQQNIKIPQILQDRLVMFKVYDAFPQSYNKDIQYYIDTSIKVSKIIKQNKQSLKTQKVEQQKKVQGKRGKSTKKR